MYFQIPKIKDAPKRYLKLTSGTLSVFTLLSVDENLISDGYDMSYTIPASKHDNCLVKHYLDKVGISDEYVTLLSDLGTEIIINDDFKVIKDELLAQMFTISDEYNCVIQTDFHFSGKIMMNSYVFGDSHSYWASNKSLAYAQYIEGYLKGEHKALDSPMLKTSVCFAPQKKTLNPNDFDSFLEYQIERVYNFIRCEPKKLKKLIISYLSRIPEEDRGSYGTKRFNHLILLLNKVIKKYGYRDDNVFWNDYEITFGAFKESFAYNTNIYYSGKLLYSFD